MKNATLILQNSISNLLNSLHKEIYEIHTGGTAMVFNAVTTGNRIRTLRESRKMSQFTLAAEMGVTRSYIGKIERGENIAKIDLYIQIATFFGVSLDYLLVSNDNDLLRKKIKVVIEVLESIEMRL